MNITTISFDTEEFGSFKFVFEKGNRSFTFDGFGFEALKSVDYGYDILAAVGGDYNALVQLAYNIASYQYIADSRKEVERAKKISSDLRKRVLELEEDLDITNQAFDTLYRTHESLTRQYDDMRDERDDLLGKNEAYRKESREVGNENVRLQLEIEGLKERLYR